MAFAVAESSPCATICATASWPSSSTSNRVVQGPCQVVQVDAATAPGGMNSNPRTLEAQEPNWHQGVADYTDAHTRSRQTPVITRGQASRAHISSSKSFPARML